VFYGVIEVPPALAVASLIFSAAESCLITEGLGSEAGYSIGGGAKISPLFFSSFFRMIFFQIRSPNQFDETDAPV
jgi:hypothetical protein